jgi:dipeptidase E
MKLLLTDSGITNPSIRNALVALLGKPIAESTALFVPTALHGMAGGAAQAYRAISGQETGSPMVQLGWKSVGVLELTALPSAGEDVWLPTVRQTDVLLVDGGDPLFLAHWMRESGLAALFPTLTDTVYVGLSAGSMVMTPSVGKAFVRWTPPDGDDVGLSLVDFSICPHVNGPDRPGNSMESAEKWAVGIGRPAYVIDGETAIQVVDGTVTVISEGTWTLLNADDYRS